MSELARPKITRTEANRIADIVCGLGKLQGIDSKAFSLTPRDLVAADAIVAVTRDVPREQIADSIERLVGARTSVDDWLVQHRENDFANLGPILWLSIQTLKASATR